MRTEDAVGGPARTEPTPERPLESLRRAIQKSALAVGLLHLPRRRYLEMSDRARALLGMQGTDLEYVDALTMSTEPDATYRVYTLILDGVLDGCRARRKLRVGDREIDAHLGVRVVARASRPSPPSQSQRRTARPEAIAIVSFSAESPAGQGAETTAAGSTADFVLTSILDVVHPDDVVQVLEAFEAAVVSAEAQAEVPVRCGPSGRATRMLVKCTGGPDRFGVTVGASDGARHAIDSDRAVELERRLRRIADEIEAAGLFQRAALVPDPDDVPGLEALSSRQWEIVTRLLRGERVPRIARAMYLSPSTVQNHLSTIFRKLVCTLRPS